MFKFAENKSVFFYQLFCVELKQNYFLCLCFHKVSDKLKNVIPPCSFKISSDYWGAKYFTFQNKKKNKTSVQCFEQYNFWRFDIIFEGEVKWVLAVLIVAQKAVVDAGLPSSIKRVWHSLLQWHSASMFIICVLKEILCLFNVVWHSASIISILCSHRN